MSTQVQQQQGLSMSDKLRLWREQKAAAAAAATATTTAPTAAVKVATAAKSTKKAASVTVKPAAPVAAAQPPTVVQVKHATVATKTATKKKAAAASTASTKASSAAPTATTTAAPKATTGLFQRPSTTNTSNNNNSNNKRTFDAVTTHAPTTAKNAAGATEKAGKKAATTTTTTNIPAAKKQKKEKSIVEEKKLVVKTVAEETPSADAMIDIPSATSSTIDSAPIATVNSIITPHLQQAQPQEPLPHELSTISDQNEDLGISLSSIEQSFTMPSPPASENKISSAHRRSRRKSTAPTPKATPIPLSLRERMANESIAEERTEEMINDSVMEEIMREEVSTAPAASSNIITTSTISNTPRAKSLRETLFELTLPSTTTAASTAKQAAAVSMTPVSASLRSQLAEEDAITSRNTAATATPHSQRLREMLFAKNTPPGTGNKIRPSAAATSCTPISAALSAKLNAHTPPDSKDNITHMILQNSARTLERQMKNSLKKNKVVHTPEEEEVQEEDVDMNNNINTLSTPPAAFNNASGSQSSSSSSTPEVVRNLMSEMEELNSSLRIAPSVEEEETGEETENVNMRDAPELEQHVEEEEHDISFQETELPLLVNGERDAADVMNDSHEEEFLFQEDEFIPGLSTPSGSGGRIPLAPSPYVVKQDSESGVMRRFSLWSASEPSPMKIQTTTNAAASTTPAHLKNHARVLTPSHAQSSDTQTQVSGSNILLASVRAHPRDAKRMGSATFVSPVRRSGRNSSTTGAAAAASNSKQEATSSSSSTSSSAKLLSEMDQTDLAVLLSENNYAYHPNPALGRQLTPIPVKRTKSVKKSAEEQKIVMESIGEEETESENDATVANTTTKIPSRRTQIQQPSTPIPPRSFSAMNQNQMSAGSSVVVLQPIRSAGRSRRSSTASPSTAPVDPRSSAYLLSPVRRSARHTAPQSLTEITKLLTKNQYAYVQNPLVEEPTILMGSQNATNVMETLIEEEEEEEEEEKEPATNTTQEEDEIDFIFSSMTPKSIRKAKLSIVREQQEEVEEEQEEEEQEEVTMDYSFTIQNSATPSSVAAVPSSRRSSGATRISTPMPLSKTKSRKSMTASSVGTPLSIVSEEVSEWQKKNAQVEAIEAAYSSSSSSTSKSYQNERDSEGFLIPLPSKRQSRQSTSATAGQKRKSSSSSSQVLEQIATKMSVAAIEMMEQQQQEYYQPSSKSSMKGTPIPQSKRQKKMSSSSSLVNTPATIMENYEQTIQQEKRVGTPLTTRRMSTRVQTPIR